MSKAYSYYYRDDWVDDLQELVSLDLTESNVQVETSVYTSNLIADGLIQSSNILNTGLVETSCVITSNLTADGLVQSSNTLNTALIETHTLSASNVTTSNLDTHTLSVTHSNFSTSNFSTSNFQGLIHINGYGISKPFPTTDGSIGDIDWWFNEEREDAPINPSWIQGDQNILSDLWNAAELGVDIAQTLADAYQFFQGGEDALTQAALDALNNALDNLGDETSSNPKIAVSWSNINNRPIATSSTSVGVRGDMYMLLTLNLSNQSQQISSQLMLTDNWK
jgi:hypothetical protein